MKDKYLIDTNILIYHVAGVRESTDFISKAMRQRSFNVSIITKIEFLGWNRHTSDGFEKCKVLIDKAEVYTLDNDIAAKAIELRRMYAIKLADAVIAATAILNKFKLVTRNVGDFRMIDDVRVVNPFQD